MNIVNSTEYQDERAFLRSVCVGKNLIGSDPQPAPLGFEFTIFTYQAGKETFSAGYLVKAEDMLYPRRFILRNHPHFPYKFIRHRDGNTYLVCGEDCQGITVVCLNTSKKVSYTPSVALRGRGFCTIDFGCYDQDSNHLSLLGRIWDEPIETRVIDFSFPMEPPYNEIQWRYEANDANNPI